MPTQLAIFAPSVQVETLEEMLNKPLDQCDEYAINAMWQAANVRNMIELTDRIENHVLTTPHLMAKMRRFKFYTPGNKKS